MQTDTQIKTVKIVSTRPRKEVTVDVAPEDTASAVLEKAGLDPNDQMLMMPGDKADFEPTEAVYPQVSEGGKLHVVPQSTVGELA